MKCIAALAIGVVSLSFAACASLPRTQLSSTDLEVYKTIVGTLGPAKEALVFVVSRRLIADKRSVCDPPTVSRFWQRVWQSQKLAPDSQTIQTYCQLSPRRLSAAQANQIGARWPTRAIFLAERTTSGVALSPIAYGRQQMEALVYVAHSSNGELWLLHLGENGWSVVAIYHLWIA